MPISITQIVAISQADYDTGVRVYYCPICRTVISGVISDPPTCKTFEGSNDEMVLGTWDSNAETFSWTKEG
jgi:hypothetical protein